MPEVISIAPSVNDLVDRYLVHQARAREVLISNEVLGVVGRYVGIFKHVYQRPGYRVACVSPTIATVVEAMFGATYIDSGNDLAAVAKLMEHFGLSYENYLTVNGPKLSRLTKPPSSDSQQKYATSPEVS